MIVLRNQPFVFANPTILDRECLHQKDQLNECFLMGTSDNLYLQFGRQAFETNLITLSMEAAFTDPDTAWKWDTDLLMWIHPTGEDALVGPLSIVDDLTAFVGKDLLVRITTKERTAGTVRVESAGAFVINIQDNVTDYLWTPSPKVSSS